MSNLYDAAYYKHKIINLLLQNELFVQLIHPSSQVEDTILQQEQVLDYCLSEDSITENKTFVLVETEIDEVRQNTMIDYNLYVYIFTDKECIRLTDQTIPTIKQIKEQGYFADTYGNRIDVLSDLVDRTLNGIDSIPGMGKLKPAAKDYVTSYCPHPQAYGKRLKYTISNYNQGGDDYGN